MTVLTMMKLKPIVLEQNQAGLRKTEQMTDLMNKVSRFQKEYKLLDEEDRNYLIQTLGFPKALVDNLVFFTQPILIQQGDQVIQQKKFMVGFNSEVFDSNIYASKPIKRALIQSHSGRCAYCETLIHNTSYGDVEHFRPKAAYTSAYGASATYTDSHGPDAILFRPGYYQQAYDTSNLFYACQICNQVYKKNYFEVIGSRYPHVSINAEVSVLINSYREDPRQYIRFNPLNGHAYAFDLVSKFYSDCNGWGPPEIAQKIWQDPKIIPGQVDAQKNSISHNHVSDLYGKWASQQKDPMTRRGLSTIAVLALNRWPLVRSRISMLRQLRGIFSVSQSSTNESDRHAAQKLLASLVSDNPSTSLLISEYVSLCIDAAHTWKAQDRNQNRQGEYPWIESYNSVLSNFRSDSETTTTPPFADALAYLIFGNELHIGGRRRLIYLSGSDKSYGHPKNQKGICLSVNWREEIDNHVIIIRARGPNEKTTLRALVNRIKDKPTSGWLIFAKSEVWVFGDFPPFKS